MFHFWALSTTTPLLNLIEVDPRPNHNYLTWFVFSLQLIISYIPLQLLFVPLFFLASLMNSIKGLSSKFSNKKFRYACFQARWSYPFWQLSGYIIDQVGFSNEVCEVDGDIYQLGLTPSLTWLLIGDLKKWFGSKGEGRGGTVAFAFAFAFAFASAFYLIEEK